MIYSNDADYLPITGAYAMDGAETLAFTAMYIGARLFWQIIRSCYGTGIWIPERPWLDNDMWKNNR